MSDPIHVVLRHRREALGMTQYALADLIRCQQSQISAMENGLGNPTFPTLQRWADALGFDVLDFQLVDRGLRRQEADAS